MESLLVFDKFEELLEVSLFEVEKFLLIFDSLFLILKFDLIDLKFTLGQKFDLAFVVLCHVCISNVRLDGLVTFNNALCSSLLCFKFSDVTINLFLLQDDLCTSCELYTPFDQWFERPEVDLILFWLWVVNELANN
mgnify:CR=1 FL=1